jgi:NAD(P)H-flavin reductase
MISRPFCIQRVRRETEDTFTVELEPVNGAGDTSFTPGQFNMLYVFGVGEIPVSISGDPKEHTKLVHTTHAGAFRRESEAHEK